MKKQSKRYFSKGISLILSLVFLAFAVLPSMEAKAYSDNDENANFSLSATGDIKINLLVAAIDPTLSSIDGKNYHNGKKNIKASEYFGFSLDKSVNFWIENFEEISHKRVDIDVVDTIIINEFPKYKSQESIDNKTFQQIFKKDANGYGQWYEGVTSEAYEKYDTAWDLDYEYYIDKLNLINRKNNNEFDMLFLIGIDPLSPCETCMVGREPLSVNGLNFYEECDNFVIISPTFSRIDGSLENVGHMAESMLGYNYSHVDYRNPDDPPVLDGSDYFALNDWQKFCLCKYLATDDTEIYGYGMVHYSPNSEADYDWNNNNKVKYYKDFKKGSKVSDFTAEDTYLDSSSMFYYEGDPLISHHRWWFYNMPYEDGRDENGYLNNWWKYIFTPYYVYSFLPYDGYTGSEIKMTVGDNIPVKFTVEDQGFNEFDSDTVQSSAPVEIKDKSVLSFSKGKIKALKKGETKITVKLDGKTIEYTVLVSDKNKEETQKEQVTAFVKRFYKVVLGRPQKQIDADTDGIGYWVNKLINGEETGSQVAYGFAGSNEFIERNVSNEEYVNILYSSFFNREPEENGYNYWLERLNAGENRIVILAGFTNSEEFKNLCAAYNINPGELNPYDYIEQNNQGKPEPNGMIIDTSKVNQKKLGKFVADLYSSTLGREGDSGGVEYWKGCILNGKDDAGNAYTISTVISRGFFLSEEYINLNKSDEEFTLDCYEAFFKRNPIGTTDEEGYRYWVNRLKTGDITRQEMIEVGFGYSAEFKNLLVNEYGFVISE